MPKVAFSWFLSSPIKRQSATTMSWNQIKSLWITKMKISYHQQAKWCSLSFGIGKVPPGQTITSDLDIAMLMKLKTWTFRFKRKKTTSSWQHRNTRSHIGLKTMDHSANFWGDSYHAQHIIQIWHLIFIVCANNIYLTMVTPLQS